MTTETRATGLADAIDRYGPDFERWPDAVLANEARAAVLADRSLRAWRDAVAALDRGLAGVRAALDAEVASSGAVARVTTAVLGRLTPQPRRFRWLAVAAALVIAAGLGGIFDLTVLAPRDSARFDVVTLDPLVFGMAEDESR